MRILGTSVKTSTIWALLFLTIAVYQLIATLLFLRVAIPTVAIVNGLTSQPITVNTESRYGSRRDTYNMKYPIIRFQAADGHEYDLLKLTPFSTYKEDQTIDILYDPKNPNKSYHKSIGAMWGFCILFSFLSILIFMYRLSILIKKNSNQHRRREGR